MTKLGPPFKKEEDKKVNRLFSLSYYVSKLLDEVIPLRQRSPMVTQWILVGLKKELKKRNA